MPQRPGTAGKLAAAFLLITVLPCAILVLLGVRLVDADRLAVQRRQSESVRRQVEFLEGNLRLGLENLAAGGEEIRLALEDPAVALEDLLKEGRDAVTARPEYAWFVVFDHEGQVLGPDLELPFQSEGSGPRTVADLVPEAPFGGDTGNPGQRYLRMLTLRSLFNQAMSDFNAGRDPGGTAELIGRMLADAEDGELRANAYLKLATIRLYQKRTDLARDLCERFLAEDPAGRDEEGLPIRALMLLLLAWTWEAEGEKDRGLENLFWLWDDLLAGRYHLDRKGFQALSDRLQEAMDRILPASSATGDAWSERRRDRRARQKAMLLRDEERRRFSSELLPAMLADGAPQGAGFHLFSTIHRDRLHVYLVHPPVGQPALEEFAPGMAIRLDTKVLLETILPDLLARATAPDIVFQVVNHRGEVTGRDDDRLHGEARVVETGIHEALPTLRLRAAAARPDSYEWMERGGTYLAVVVVSILVVAVSSLFVFRTYSRERRLMKLRSDFVSNVTHELKTPLTSISMFIDTLRLGRMTAPEKQKEYYDLIHGETQRLGRLIDNVLDFSRIEAGRKTYRFAALDAADLLERVVASLAPPARLNRIELVLEVADRPLMVSGDEDALERVLHNLISNAMKFPGAERVVTVRGGRRQGRVCLEVEDRGPGIPPAERERIFDKFYRIERAGFETVPGTGLGLALVRSIVTNHGGSVSVESEVGKGSCFQVLIPEAERT